MAPEVDPPRRSMARVLLDALLRIRTRLLIVNAVVLLVPFFGVEFARLYESQLLEALERDMHNQAVVTAAFLADELERGIPVDDPAHERVLARAARRTRTRVRLLDDHGRVVADSHAEGPPEGPESVVADRFAFLDGSARTPGPPWPDIPLRSEVVNALREAKTSTYTRVRARAPAVLLFLAHPIEHRDRVVGVVYVVRSTQPVLIGLYRIRGGLVRILAVALALTVSITLLLGFSISRPLARLSRAARRIAAGERDVDVPVSGSGEVRELGDAFATMTARLEERLRYAKDLAADVAHEFKSPLTSIRGAAELLAEGAADDPEARARFLSNIELDVERLDRLVSRLLELGRLEAAEAEKVPFDLGTLLERIAARSESPDVGVDLVLASPHRMARGRPGDLEIALANLVENAIRFSPAGERVRVSLEEDGRSVVVRVEDRGPGVAPEHRERVFDRFFTTDAERHGTGLGLAIARTVARAHGGDVRLLATDRPGATFELRIPRGL